MNQHFERAVAASGVSFIRCPALGAPHGFSTRLGGLSEGPFEALNLGAATGDSDALAYRNRALWSEALGFEPPIMGLHQKHGAVVHAVDQRQEETLYGDGIVSATPRLPISIFTADCTPILLHDPLTGAVGAVHAGWRGTVAQVVIEAVKRMETAYGARPETLRAAIGPAIGPCCFEVGSEVKEAAESKPWPGWQEAFVAGPRRDHMDLFSANRQQLISAGLAPAHVFSSGLCTFCRADLFYSWRRDQGRTGRMQAAIASEGSQAP